MSLAWECSICHSTVRNVRNPRKWGDPGAGIYCTGTWHDVQPREQYFRQSAHAAEVMRRYCARAFVLGAHFMVHDGITFTGTPEEQRRKADILSREWNEGKFN